MKPVSLQKFLQQEGLDEWAQLLPTQLMANSNMAIHGDSARWRQVVETLPLVKPVEIDFNKATITLTPPANFSRPQQQALASQLMTFKPWRKGPFSVLGVYIDSEWRSDWKWQRIRPHLSALQNRLVLDIGCGNGYHCWRMLGEGARRVIGIDPNLLNFYQFAAIKHFCGSQPVDLVPIGIEQLPADMQAFDSVFSMGVLYHRRSPIDHLYQLKGLLRPQGELILETLIVAGDKHTVLLPQGRYARMRNVWFIPSTDAMHSWLARCGFKDIRLVDVSRTTSAEQRSTKWMTFESLADCLQENQPDLTVEGYPAPTRAVFIAHRP